MDIKKVQKIANALVEGFANVPREDLCLLRGNMAVPCGMWSLTFNADAIGVDSKPLSRGEETVLVELLKEGFDQILGRI